MPKQLLTLMMHACSFISVILRHAFVGIYHASITSWVCFSQPNRGGSQSFLTTLSQVCRIFKNVTLDVLWAKLENLEPLVFHKINGPRLLIRLHFQVLPLFRVRSQPIWVLPLYCCQIARAVTTEDCLGFERCTSRMRDPGIFRGMDSRFIHATMAFLRSQNCWCQTFEFSVVEHTPVISIHVCLIFRAPTSSGICHYWRPSHYLLPPKLLGLLYLGPRNCGWSYLPCSATKSL
ncbi:hypothetical protein EDD22DRAFT_220701 [Suillus occidentalis]|nr:hypothetical protein EDD22DRAFT_220701 [Suillus occidentalis]